MTIDRRAWDPWAPPPRPQPVAVGRHAKPDVVPEPKPAAVETEPEPEGLDALKRAELNALAREHDIDHIGTRADLVARLAAAGLA